MTDGGDYSDEERSSKVHLHHIYRKLGIANRTALAVLAHTKSLDVA
jgi:DNA-binding NarL/FixJ family response regulator